MSVFLAGLASWLPQVGRVSFGLKNADYHFKLEGITALLKKMDYHDVTIAIDGSVTIYIHCNYGVKKNPATII